jgi:hypothetical protein
VPLVADWVVTRVMLACWPAPEPPFLWRPSPPSLAVLVLAVDAFTALKALWTLLWVVAFADAAPLWAAATADWTLMTSGPLS